MSRIFDLCDIKHKTGYLTVILIFSVILFSSCSSEDYKNGAEKTLRDNQDVFDHIARYILSQSETDDNKYMRIYGENFLAGDKSIVKDPSLHSIIHEADDPDGLEGFCCIPIEDEQILEDIRYLFEDLQYVDIFLRESKWKNDVEVIFTKYPSDGKWESYIYHTTDFPPEAKEGYSVTASYQKINGLEYAGSSLYLGDSWYYNYGDIVY